MLRSLMVGLGTLSALSALHTPSEPHIDFILIFLSSLFFAVAAADWDGVFLKQTEHQDGR